MPNGKIRVNVDAVYKDGTFLYDDMKVPARIFTAVIQKAPAFSEVTIRMVVSSKMAEEFYETLEHANTVSLSIEDITSPLERDEKRSEGFTRSTAFLEREKSKGK